MNVFRIAADLSHLASIFILLYAIYTRRSTRGLSFKSQLLYFIVFATRYLDIFGPFPDEWGFFKRAYLFLMKLFFIGTSGYVLYLMKYKYRFVYPHCDTHARSCILTSRCISGRATTHL